MPFTQNYQKQSVLVKTTTYQSCLVLLPRDASTALAVMQCLSVCLSVRHIRESKRGIKTNKDIFEIFHRRVAHHSVCLLTRLLKNACMDLMKCCVLTATCF